MHFDPTAPICDLAFALDLVRHHATLALPALRLITKPAIHGACHRLAHFLKHRSHTVHHLLRWEYSLDLLMLCVGVLLDIVPESGERVAGE
jgi:hypothetical protein